MHHTADPSNQPSQHTVSFKVAQTEACEALTVTLIIASDHPQLSRNTQEPAASTTGMCSHVAQRYCIPSTAAVGTAQDSCQLLQQHYLTPGPCCMSTDLFCRTMVSACSSQPRHSSDCCSPSEHARDKSLTAYAWPLRWRQMCPPGRVCRDMARIPLLLWPTLCLCSSLEDLSLSLGHIACDEHGSPCSV